MAREIVLISGSVASGKTTLVNGLQRRFDVEVLKTRHIIVELATKRHKNIEAERKALQEFGQKLDKETKGEWVRDALQRLDRKVSPDAIIVVDAVRIPDQIKAIREAYGARVQHVHLQAPTEVLSQRYSNRTPSITELKSLKEVSKNKTEARVKTLEDRADIVVDTKLCTVEDVLARVSSHLGLFSRDYGQLVDVLVGGEWGSEGKGHIASYLAPEYSLLIRVGGPNAGHKVFLAPEPFTHHQLPSGTQKCEAKLTIAPGAVLNVDDLLKEISKCKVDAQRLSIDPQAMIISPKDISRENALKKDIGSTGQGVGFATARRITDRGKGVKLAKDIPLLRPFIREVWEILENSYVRGEKILVEGTQGAGLSLFHGEYPYVTSRDTGVAGALSEAGIPPKRVRRTVMVCRTYPIRVQNPKDATSGPMGIEIDWQVVADRSGLDVAELRGKEITSTTKRDRRVAEFNWSMLRRAAALNGPTDIALTFADYLRKENAQARRYEKLTPATIMFIEEVQRVAAAPVSLISTRFDFRGIIDRRAW